MNFYIYRKLTVSEKRSIAFFLGLLLTAIILTAITMPQPDSECILESSATVGTSVVLTIKQKCVNHLIESITFASQIKHILTSAICFIFIYLIIYFVDKFFTWVNKRPNS